MFDLQAKGKLNEAQARFMAPEKPKDELYDLQADPHERFNLYGQPDHAETQKQLAAKLDDWFESYANPEYDIWKGGRSKARRHYAPKGHPDYRPLRKF